MNEDAGRQFLGDLALYFHNSTTDSIPFEEMADRFPRYFPSEFWSPERERLGEALRSASFLTNDETGCYRFVHRSFLEYFLAERLVRAIEQQELDIHLDRFPSKVTDAFILDLMAFQSRWPQQLVRFMSAATGPIPRYLGIYLIKRLAASSEEVARQVLIDEMSARLGIEGTPFVTRELLVTMVDLGADIEMRHIDSHLNHPIDEVTIKTELKDYYGSLEEARRYLRIQLAPGRQSSLRLFYVISLASICTNEDKTLLQYHHANGTVHESTVAANALATLAEESDA